MSLIIDNVVSLSYTHLIINNKLLIYFYHPNDSTFCIQTYKICQVIGPFLTSSFFLFYHHLDGLNCAYLSYCSPMPDAWLCLETTETFASSPGPPDFSHFDVIIGCRPLCLQDALSAASNAWGAYRTRLLLPPSCCTRVWPCSVAVDTRPSLAPSPSSRTTLRLFGALWMLWTSSPCEFNKIQRPTTTNHRLRNLSPKHNLSPTLLHLEIIFWVTFHLAGLTSSSTSSTVLRRRSLYMAYCWWWRASSLVEPSKTCTETSRSPHVGVVSVPGWESLTTQHI